MPDDSWAMNRRGGHSDTGNSSDLYFLNFELRYARLTNSFPCSLRLFRRQRDNDHLWSYDYVTFCTLSGTFC